MPVGIEGPALQRLDHPVLTVRGIAASIAFYRDHLGMVPLRFGEGRHALAFGAQKSNLHEAGRDFEPKTATPCPGSADRCFPAGAPVDRIAAGLTAAGIEVIEGPVRRTGASGPILSIYLRDPDGNLIELSNPLEAA